MISPIHNNQPFFTIITPSLNQGTYIRRTIESVLSQSFNDFEYLIFDGGSNDETLDILRSYTDRISWKSEHDRGQAHAVNKGMRGARGEVIGWLNSDDVYYPGALKAVNDIFLKYPDMDIMYGMADHIDENDRVIEPYYNDEWNYEDLKNVCFICQPAVFFRRSLVKKIGMLDESLRYCMDYEYWLRIGKENTFYYLKQKLAGSRLYSNTKTLGSAIAVHEEILRMFKNKFRGIPSKWIYNHAHVIARESGLSQELPDDNLKFVKKVVSVSILSSIRLRHYVPLSELKSLLGWYINARKAIRKRET